MDSTNVRKGTLTWAEFRTQCSQFVATSTKRRDNWVLRSVAKDEDEPGHSYLEKRITSVMATQRSTEDAVVAMATSGAAEDLALEDAEAPQESDVQTASVVQGVSDDRVTREYHVLYSLSYAVPVLYFNVWNQDGSLAPLDDIWRQVPLAFATNMDRANKWGAITQQEHPLLGRPYFYIHPCQTENLMKNCQNNLKIRNYLITWLSMFGPLVGLDIPLSYAV